jgi:hypothetical protein
MENLQKVLRILGVHISFAPTALCRILKMTNHYFIGKDILKIDAYKMAGEYLLPALCIVKDCNDNLIDILED